MSHRAGAGSLSRRSGRTTDCWACRAAEGPPVATPAARAWVALEVQDSQGEVQGRASRPAEVSLPSTRTCSLSIQAQPTCSRPPLPLRMARMRPQDCHYYHIHGQYRPRTSRHPPRPCLTHHHSAATTLLSHPHRRAHRVNLTSHHSNPLLHPPTTRLRQLSVRQLTQQYLTAATPLRSLPPRDQIPRLVTLAAAIRTTTRWMSENELFIGKQGRWSASSGGGKVPARGRAVRRAPSVISP